eukprot:193828-Rhodomonas_salina.3
MLCSEVWKRNRGKQAPRSIDREAEFGTAAEESRHLTERSVSRARVTASGRICFRVNGSAPSHASIRCRIARTTCTAPRSDAVMQ